MAWLVKQYPDGKFGLWSTITDSYIVRKCTKAHMIQAIEKMWRRGWREQIKKLNDEFPVGWLDRDTHAPIREEKPPTYCNHEDRTHEVFSSNGETHYLCDKCYKLYLSYAKKEEK